MMNRRALYGCVLSLALTLPLTGELLQPQSSVAQQLTAANSQGSSLIKEISLVTTDAGLQLVIVTEAGKRPQVFFTQQGNAWVGDITNAELGIVPGQDHYRQDAPAPGISYLEARQLESDSVRLEVVGTNTAPQGLLSERSATKLVFDFGSLESGQSAAPVAQAPAVNPPTTVAQLPSTSSETVPTLPAQPVSGSTSALPASQPTSPESVSAAQPAAPSAVAQSAESVTPAEPVVLSQVPSLEQLNQPAGVPNPSSPFQGRAMAPAVGDIAVSTIISQPPPIDLGTNETVTLTLKEAPVAEVLSLLVRRSGLNIVLNDVPPGETISLDVQDAPLQDTFNYVLRLKQLQSNRIEQTVFVGQSLPGVGEQVMRTWRLNQAVVEDETLDRVGFEGLTDEALIEIDRKGIQAQLLELVADGGPLSGPPPVQLFFDRRTNSVTALGSPHQLDILGAYIAQIDVRQRQVLMSVRLVEVNVSDDETLGVALGGTSGNFALSGLTPVGGDFGGSPIDQPAGSSVPNVGANDSGIGDRALNFNTLNELQNALALRIEAAVQSGTAKTLADPKLVVSDGGQNVVTIGQQVIINRRLVTDPATGQTTEELVFGTAGVVLSLLNVKVDDNGYVTLDLNPLVASPAQVVNLAGGVEITLLNTRALSAQQLRLRDGETFVLSGLIQENDTVSVDKVPLLGDIPLLGSLFRRQSTQNDRTEIVLMITPRVLPDDGSPFNQVSSVPFP